MTATIPPKTNLKRIFQGTAQRFVQMILALGIWGTLLFAAAGRLNWWQAWVYFLCYFAGLAANAWALIRYNPSLAAERAHSHAGTKQFDKVFAALYTPMLFVLPVVAGFDAGRYSWWALAPSWLYVGVVLQLVGTIPVSWAMAVNPHLETTVRIQSDRGHRVIRTGPYKCVRHPMYIGVMLQMLAIPLVLGSGWTLVPALIVVALFVFRTYMEDKTLQVELPGYADYAQHTKYRLVPGLW